MAVRVAAEPPVDEEWVPTTDVPDQVRDLLGTWHWGHAPSVLTWDGRLLHATPAAGAGRHMSFALQADGSWVGATGYLAGERLTVHRRDDGSPAYIECATFIWTRSPYDPQAPIPGGTGRS